jgi:spore coat polysaccharide biosynthesis protein SpsF
MNNNNIGIIIQARFGSTRLPQKMVLPFFENLSVFELLLNKFKKNFGNIPIILATSDNSNNNILEKIAQKKGIKVFRGDENDVLNRFINAAQAFNIKKIIRICADNPFFDVQEMEKLLIFIQNNPQYDYVSFWVNGLPSIKTHFGFWGEYVSFNALEKVNNLTSLQLYHEHVTNYIYEHPDLFNIHFLKPNSIIHNRNDIRMTLDTPSDFQTLSDIYGLLSDRYSKFGINEIITFLDENPYYKIQMKEQINNNTK